MKAFYPDAVLTSIYEIDYAFLTQHNIKAVIFDIDNTLVPFKTLRPDERLISYIDTFKQNGIKVAVLSNNKKLRVDTFNEGLLMYAIAKAGKPGRKSYRLALTEFGCRPQEVLVVGDQLFTDIYGGKRNNMTAVLVRPIKKDTDWFIIFKRVIEKFLLKHGVKRGYISIKEYNIFMAHKENK